MAESVSLSFDAAAEEAPRRIVLAPSEDIRVESVTARWDGAGASGSFLACLAMYSQDGKLLSRTFPSTIMAAGDSGVVTYIPFLGGDTPSDAVTSGTSWRARTAGTTTIPSGVKTNITFPTVAINGLAVTTSDDHAFSLPAIGTKPMYLCGTDLRFNMPVGPALPFTIMVFGPTVQRTFTTISTLAAGFAPEVWNLYPVPGNAGMSVEVWQDSGVDLVLFIRRLDAIYQGQYGGTL